MSLFLVILATCALACLPGLAALLWLTPAAGVTALERFALSVGISLSLTPLLYLWITSSGMALAGWLMLPALLACLAIAVVLHGRTPGDLAPWRFTGRAASWYLVIAICGALTLWLRFQQIEGLSFPVWVDSLHHTLLIRVAAEQGVAPLTLRPFLPIDNLTYHWGYHVVIAALARLLNAEIPNDLPRLTLWSGQILSALMPPAYAALAIRLWRRPIAGAAVALVIGLLSVMPAYYVSWGRYTLLSGMLILPAVLIAADALRRRPEPATAALLALLLAGLSLVHFIVFVLALAACGALLMTLDQPFQARRIAQWMLTAGGGAALLTLPWLWLLARQALPGTGSSAMHIAGNAAYNALPYGLLWAGTNQLLLALAGLGGLAALLRRRRNAAWLILWCALAIVLANPVLFGLPYLSFVTNEMLTITMFAPLALLIGGGIAELEARAPRSGRRGNAYHAAALLLATIVAFWSINHWRNIIRADTILAGAADEAAIAWVASAIPPEARFVVGTAGWLYDVDRGVDGGWWLLPLTGRQVSTPPVIFNYGAPADVATIKRDTAWLRERGANADAAQLAAFMRDRGYQYVYASERPGGIRAAPLRESAFFETLFSAGDVTILRLR